MKPFTYEKATGLREAAAAVAARPDAKFIAGGTNLLDLRSWRSSVRHILSISAVCRCV